MSMGRHHSPTPETSDTWLTPPAIIQALGIFDLDPCAAPSPRPWDTAIEHVELPDDGLDRQWHGRVWLNPPYGRDMGPWLGKLADGGNGIALLFARTETDDWHTYIWPRANAILFLRGRINFYFPDGSRSKKNAGAPSALIAFGSANVDALRNSAIRGKLVVLA